MKIYCLYYKKKHCTLRKVDKLILEDNVAKFLKICLALALEVYNSFNLSAEDAKKFKAILAQFEDFCKSRKIKALYSAVTKSGATSTKLQ